MTSPSATLPAFAGFRRRVVAFLVDGVVLGLVGWALGAVFYDPLVQLGAWGRGVGFLVAMAYFVPQESRRGGGQSVGKRMLGIRVVDAAGMPLAAQRTLLRFAVFGVPYFLCGAELPMAVDTFLGGFPLALLALGGVLALGYLFVFNRRTRQSLHDLASAAFVVRVSGIPGEQASPVPAARTWRGHLGVAAVLALVAGLTPLMVPQLMHWPTYAAEQAVYSRVAAQPEVLAANVFEQASVRHGVSGDTRERTLLVMVDVASPVRDGLPLATRLAGLALDTYPQADRLDRIVVQMKRGFDLGIATSWSINTLDFTPSQWRDRVQAGTAG